MKRYFLSFLLAFMLFSLPVHAEENVSGNTVPEEDISAADDSGEMESLSNRLNAVEINIQSLQEILSKYEQDIAENVSRQDMTNDLLVYLIQSGEDREIAKEEAWVTWNGHLDAQHEEVMQSVSENSVLLEKLVKAREADITNSEMSKKLGEQLEGVSGTLSDANYYLGHLDVWLGYMFALFIIFLVIAIAVIFYYLIHNTIIKHMF